MPFCSDSSAYQIPVLINVLFVDKRYQFLNSFILSLNASNAVRILAGVELAQARFFHACHPSFGFAMGARFCVHTIVPVTRASKPYLVFVCALVLVGEGEK